FRTQYTGGERISSSDDNRFKLTTAVNTAARDVGKVVAIREVAGSPGVVVFQERHGSQRGQVEIALMLDRLYEAHGLRNLGQEGVFTADGQINSSWYHPSLQIGHPLNQRQKVAVQVLSEGEISSGEAMALLYSDFAVHGLEKAVEYNVDIPSSDPTISYLL